jgi:hypothetical protein
MWATCLHPHGGVLISISSSLKSNLLFTHTCRHCYGLYWKVILTERWLIGVILTLFISKPTSNIPNVDDPTDHFPLIWRFKIEPKRRALLELLSLETEICYRSWCQLCQMLRNAERKTYALKYPPPLPRVVPCLIKKQTNVYLLLGNCSQTEIRGTTGRDRWRDLSFARWVGKNDAYILKSTALLWIHRITSIHSRQTLLL